MRNPDGTCYCERCEIDYDDTRCPSCPSDEQVLSWEKPDFYELANRVWDEHEWGSPATKCSAFSDMMQKVWDAAVKRTREEPR